MSISESGWGLIAVAATAFFMVTMRAMIKELKAAGEQRRTPVQQTEQGGRTSYAVALVLAAVVLLATRLGSEPASVFLFLYSVAFAAIPIALYPVRGRLIEASIAQRQNPDLKIKTDRLMTAWIIGFLSLVCLGATLVLMGTEYGTGT
ncbi:hypothetical protein RM590_13670 [Streptomyces sp. DSM 44938]|uniref:Integral membrane protein n=1 Tax=Streptomyces litchfieldiae TaxID=3075543 RepID=A0ABU2MQA1_9ACTN|nr:hypothetical protein [Streptomyces sp. DSM 44938]